MAHRAHGDYRITENPEVGAGGDAFDRVGGVRIPPVEVRHDGRGKMSTCGRTHDPDLPDVPCICVFPHHANRPGRVGGDFTVGVHRTEPVFQHESTDPVRSKKQCVVFPLMFRKAAVGPSGANNNRSTGCCARVRRVHRQSRIIFFRFHLQLGPEMECFLCRAACNSCKQNKRTKENPGRRPPHCAPRVVIAFSK